jgi:hypothetical protein
MNIAIICACAPSLKSVTGQFFRDLSTKSNSKQSTENDEKNQNTYGSGSYPKQSTTDSSVPLMNSRSSTTKSAGSLVHGFSFNKNRRSKHDPLYDLTSFEEAHEMGMDTYSPVVEGYGDRHLTHLAGSSSTQVNEDEPPTLPATVALPVAPQEPKPTFSGNHPIPSAVITIRPSSAVESTQNKPAPLPGRTRSTAQGTQPAEAKIPRSVSPVSSNSPSIIFINNEHDTEDVVRVKYRSFVESSSSEENLSLSFPAMNPGHKRAQSLRDDHELAAKAALRAKAAGAPTVDGRPSTSPAVSAIPQPKQPPKPEEVTRATQTPSPTPTQERGWVRNALNNVRMQSNLRRSTSNPIPIMSHRRYRNSQSHIESPSESDASSIRTVSTDADGDPVLPFHHPDASDPPPVSSPARIAKTTSDMATRTAIPKSNNPYAAAMSSSIHHPTRGMNNNSRSSSSSSIGNGGLATQHDLSTPLYSVFPLPPSSRPGSRPGTAPGDTGSSGMVRTFTTITQHSESAANMSSRWGGTSSRVSSAAVGPASTGRSASALGNYASAEAIRPGTDREDGTRGIGRPMVRRVLSRERSRWYP